MIIIMTIITIIISTEWITFQQMDIARISKPRDLFPEGFHKVFLQSSHLCFNININMKMMLLDISRSSPFTACTG